MVKEIYEGNVVTLDGYLNMNGISDVEEFLNPTGKYIDSFAKYENMKDAVQEIEYWAKYGEAVIYIIQDTDVDGICSAYIVYMYLSKLCPSWNVKILLHTSKQRGLEDDDIMERILEDKPNLVIVPDAGSNNKKEANILCEEGIGLIVLDHHNITDGIEYGILVNNQIESQVVSVCGSGALVAHKFLCALDDKFDLNWSGYFIDIVALSLISDSMDMSNMENRTYYHFGLETRDCISNRFLLAMVDKFIGEKPYTQRDISFRIVPKLNAITRSQDQELKKRIIMALAGAENNEEVLALCEKAHADQIATVDKIMELNKDSIDLSNNIIFLASDEIPRSYSGLVSGKVMQFSGNKPSIVGSIKDGYFIGSLRSPIPLQKELNDNELVDFCSGHDCSAGFGIAEENIEKFIKYYNEKEMSYERCDLVLKSYSARNIPQRLFSIFNTYPTLWGKGLSVPVFEIRNITFMPQEVSILGNNKRTLKIKTDTCDFIIFNCTKEDKTNFGLGYYEDGVFVEERKSSPITISCIGTLSVNEFRGKKTNQVIIDRYEITQIEKKEITDIF